MDPIIHLLRCFCRLIVHFFFLVGIGYLTLTSVFNGLSKTRLTMNVTLINFIILLGLSPILAQAYGVIGVILAYLIAGAIASLYAALIAVKQLKLSFDFKSLLLIYLLSAVSSFPSLALLFLTSLNSLVVLAFGIFTYLVVFVTLMPLMHVVNKEELQELARITGRIPLLKFVTTPIFKYQRKLMLVFDS
ncbi:MAG: polysaccharide biosynthesis C-terminal domain-containing protein [Candidatus Bathyarchaeota archaeon]|nr:polysaccharide biosynthesis C-terminal domain-containing protein [Candidatus Bathyarchaeota archaeon]